MCAGDRDRGAEYCYCVDHDHEYGYESSSSEVRPLQQKVLETPSFRDALVHVNVIVLDRRRRYIPLE